MAESDFDLIVIGPGGYVAATRAAQLGMKTACVHREYLGGTCLNVGCIPSKARLDSSVRPYAAKHQLASHGFISVDLTKLMTRKDDIVAKLSGGVVLLFRKHKIEHLWRRGRLMAPAMVQELGSVWNRLGSGALIF